MKDLSVAEGILLTLLTWASWCAMYYAGKINLIGCVSDMISEFGRQLEVSKEELEPMTDPVRGRLIHVLMSKPYGHSTYEEFADYLMSQSITAPPVVVGQTVYLIRRPVHRSPFVVEETVDRVTAEYTKDGVMYKFGNRYFSACHTDLGKTVFTDNRNAEKTLKGEQ